MARAAAVFADAISASASAITAFISSSALPRVSAIVASSSGWRADQARTMHGVDLCACVCAAVLEDVVRGLQKLRPLATIRIRDSDARVGALARPSAGGQRRGAIARGER